MFKTAVWRHWWAKKPTKNNRAQIWKRKGNSQIETTYWGRISLGTSATFRRDSWKAKKKKHIFIKLFHFEIIADPYAAVRNNTEKTTDFKMGKGHFH